MIDILLFVSHLAIGIAVLTLLRGKEYTKLYPLIPLSSALLVACTFSPLKIGWIGSTMAFFVVKDMLKNGYTTLEGYRPKVKIPYLVLSLVASSILIALLPDVNSLFKALYCISFVTLFTMMADAREKVYRFVGDHLVLKLCSLLVVIETLTVPFDPYIQAYVKFSYAYLFLLTQLRTSSIL